ncbi:hypothetical protein [Sulfurimonas marina]|uniref:Uncharacterized protein n=1 Tax=Sulfurimonas marina TaxID=2590551 RepID=A0A7M1AUH3_9BACT|nr:hypothetical protein [Sulfurimonas marina]QOP41060.1 hypothetical protein FJR03_04615 [Sulfurimonas marina]
MKKIFVVILSLSMFSTLLLAVGPGNGTESKYIGKQIGKCYVDKITVKYKLDSLMGEAIVNGAYKATGSDSDCKLPYSTVVWLKVKNNSGGYGYVKLAPTSPKTNGRYGYNVSGSPSWNDLICGYSGTRKTSCLDSSSAKNIWKTGYVSDFVVQW